MSDDRSLVNPQPLVEGEEPAVLTDSSRSPKEFSTAPAHEVSATSIGRMMGLATSNEMALLEGKVDLLTTKFSMIVGKLDKLIAATGDFPSGSDLERIDVQIGALRKVIQDALDNKLGQSRPSDDASSSQTQNEKSEGAAKKRPNIFVSKPTNEA